MKSYKSKFEKIQAVCLNQISLQDIHDLFAHKTGLTINTLPGGAIDKLIFESPSLTWEAEGDDWIVFLENGEIFVLANTAFLKSFTPIQPDIAP